MASRPFGALYTGSAGNLRAAVERHRAGQGNSHTAQYKIDRLVWFEAHDSRAEALTREKRIKRWVRQWKFDLISKFNPDWRDLTDTLPSAAAGEAPDQVRGG